MAKSRVEQLSWCCSSMNLGQDHVSVHGSTRKTQTRTRARTPRGNLDTESSSKRIASQNRMITHFADDSKIWPPRHLRRWDKLTLNEVLQLVDAGAVIFKGYAFQAPHTTHHQRRYCIVTDETPLEAPRPLLPSLSHTLGSPEEIPMPHSTLEQPSMLSAHGPNAGTTTLNYWISTSKTLRAQDIPDMSYITARPLGIVQILERLCCVQYGLESNLCERRSMLYKELLQVTDGVYCFGSSKDEFDYMGQIKDITAALYTNDWADFSQPPNQIMATFLESPNLTESRKFFMQLTLGMELYHRLQSPRLDKAAKTSTISALPLQVAYDVVFAKLWIRSFSLRMEDEKEKSKRGCQFTMIHRDSQLSLLGKFARDINWPSTHDIETSIDDMRGSDGGKSSTPKHHFAMTWETNVILPGPSTYWLLMMSLVQLDPETTTALKGLEHMRINTGFQHKGSTIWYWECIVGKVLGASHEVQQVAGWISSCLPSCDLEPTQLVRIKQHEIQHCMRTRKIRSMEKRTRPIGPLDNYYPVDDYSLPKLATTAINPSSIRIEKLSLRPLAQTPDATFAGDTHIGSLVFLIIGHHVHVPLRYNVSFIASVTCHSGPHPLYFDYPYHSVPILELASMLEWGHASALHDVDCNSSSNSRAQTSAESFNSADTGSSDRNAAQVEPDCVLVIEAFGSTDAAVFARAWCAHLGLSAIVADLGETCVSCAIRAAYAAFVEVVILTHEEGDDDFGGCEQEFRREEK